MDESISILIQLMSEKNPTLLTHSLNVAMLSSLMAEKLEYDCHYFYTAGLLHDVGKILLPNSLLDKSIQLTSEELQIIKNHTYYGSMILTTLNLKEYAHIALNHHNDTQSQAINVQIISIADKFEAMTSFARYYKKPKTKEQALEELYTLNIYEQKLLYALEKTIFDKKQQRACENVKARAEG
ncbi:HD-GYP domain-containing protein [Caldicellulosiruptoraceae bacterium PP1]